MAIIRVALPDPDNPGKTFNVLTDTNPDHFSLLADIDNVLIKRLLTSLETITDGSPTIKTIPHNLNYIPFFIVYVDNNSDGNWSIVNNQYNPFQVPQEISFADITNLYIYNFGGHSSGNAPFAWDIFYDDMSQTGNPVITESPQVLKVGRPTIDVTQSKNPNDYIMHSDLNNFKILKQGNKSTTLTFPTIGASYDFAHGADIQAPFKYFCFVKFPDGKIVLTGGANQFSYDGSYSVTSFIDDTNIYLNFNGKYYSAGYDYASTASDDGGGSLSWTNVNGVKNSSYSDYASYFSNSASWVQSNYIKVSNFGFSLPSDAIIDGIDVNIGQQATRNTSSPLEQGKDAHVHLMKAGSEVGSDKADSNPYGTGGFYDQYYSFSTSGWSYSDINNSGFGVRFASQTYDQNGYNVGVAISYIRVAIYYHRNISTDITIYYVVYGTGKDNTIDDSGATIEVAASGKNVLTDTNPDNFNFHSNYPTLKYYASGSYSMGTITNTTIHTIPHNLNYIPVIIGFINDIAGFSSGASTNFCIMPYYWGLGTIYNALQHTYADIFATIYADDTNIYLKVDYGDASVGTSISPVFYYKLFKNNTGL